jgi:hypothetical protein
LNGSDKVIGTRSQDIKIAPLQFSQRNPNNCAQNQIV